MAETAAYRGTGKRKTSVARVILEPGTGKITVNGREFAEYFPRGYLRAVVSAPLIETEQAERFDVRARLGGGGISGQAGALRHGIARALCEADPELRTALKREQYVMFMSSTGSVYVLLAEGLVRPHLDGEPEWEGECHRALRLASRTDDPVHVGLGVKGPFTKGAPLRLSSRRERSSGEDANSSYCPQRVHHLHARGAQRRQHPAHEAHPQREGQGLCRRSRR